MKKLIKTFLLLLFSAFFITFTACDLLFKQNAPLGENDDFDNTTKADPDTTKTDWLFLMYLDGDNDLNDSIYFNMKMVENGLYKLNNAQNAESVKVVVLWDGISQADFSKTYDGTRYLHRIKKGGSYIFELGMKEGDFIEPYYTKADFTPLLSKESKNVSASAGKWLNYSEKNGFGEVNMADYQTLKNFLQWANDTYTADHIFLTVSDHGSGPFSKTENVRNAADRAICLDVHSDSQVMDSNKFATALKDSGVKLDVLMYDACLCASIEDLYECKDYADYVIASPQSSSSFGIPYHNLMDKVFVKSLDMEEKVTQLIDTYAHYYSRVYEEYAKSGFGDNYFGENVIYNGSTSNFYNTLTLSAFNTKNVQNLTDKINEYAGLFLEEYENFKNNPDNSEADTFTTILNDEEHALLRIYPEDSGTISDKNFSSNTNYTKPGTLFYEGSYYILHDIGYLMDRTIECTTNTELKLKSAEVIEALQNVIIYSWRRDSSSRDNNLAQYESGIYKGFNKGLYPKLNTTNSYGMNNYYGLTICGSYNTGVIEGELSYATYNCYLKDRNIDSKGYYTYTTSFGTNSNWNELLSILYPTLYMAIN